MGSPLTPQEIWLGAHVSPGSLSLSKLDFCFSSAIAAGGQRIYFNDGLLPAFPKREESKPFCTLAAQTVVSHSDLLCSWLLTLPRGCFVQKQGMVRLLSSKVCEFKWQHWTIYSSTGHDNIKSNEWGKKKNNNNNNKKKTYKILEGYSCKQSKTEKKFRETRGTSVYHNEPKSPVYLTHALTNLFHRTSVVLRRSSCVCFRLQQSPFLWGLLVPLGAVGSDQGIESNGSPTQYMNQPNQLTGWKRSHIATPCQWVIWIQTGCLYNWNNHKCMMYICLLWTRLLTLRHTDPYVSFDDVL